MVRNSWFMISLPVLVCTALAATAWVAWTTPDNGLSNSAGKRMPPDAAPLERQVFRQLLNEPTTLDIGIALYDAQFMAFIFEPLCVFTPDVELAPAAAERWTVSADRKTWTFYLREGLRWSDGRPLTATDFAWSFQRLVDPNTGNVYAFFYYPIKGAREFHTGQTTDRNVVAVRAIDDRTLQIETLKPCSYLPMVAAFFTSVPAPRWQIKKYGRKWIEPGRIVSNSTWALDTWTPGVGMTFKLNPYYTGPYTGYLERLEFKFVTPGFTGGVLAYENGEVDMVGVSPADYRRIKNDPRLSQQFISYPNFGTYYLFFQTRKPPFNDVRVRQAVAHAIDRQAITNVVLAGAGFPAYGMIPPGFPGYAPERLKPYQRFDPELARKLLADAGYPNGRGFPRMSLWLRAPTAVERNVGVAIQQMLKDHLNIQVDLEERTMGVFNDRMIQHKIPWGFVWFNADYYDLSDMIDPPWRSRPPGSGRQDWKNERFDRLVDQAAQEFDEPKRIALYQEAERILAEDVGGVFLYNTLVVNLVNPKLKGIIQNRYGHRRWAGLPPDYARIYFSR